MTQIQVGSPEQRVARWVIYAVLAAPIVATLLHDLGVGAVAPLIIYAILAARAGAFAVGAVIETGSHHFSALRARVRKRLPHQEIKNEADRKIGRRQDDDQKSPQS